MTAKKAQPQPTQPIAVLLSLVDLGEGTALQAEANAVAARVAREMSARMTQAQRIAAHEFLTDVARHVRWPLGGSLPA
jgi:hypothetical protein